MENSIIINEGVNYKSELRSRQDLSSKVIEIWAYSTTGSEFNLASVSGSKAGVKQSITLQTNQLPVGIYTTEVVYDKGLSSFSVIYPDPGDTLTLQVFDRKSANV